MTNPFGQTPAHGPANGPLTLFITETLAGCQERATDAMKCVQSRWHILLILLTSRKKWTAQPRSHRASGDCMATRSSRAIVNGSHRAVLSTAASPGFALIDVIAAAPIAISIGKCSNPASRRDGTDMDRACARLKAGLSGQIDAVKAGITARAPARVLPDRGDRK